VHIEINRIVVHSIYLSFGSLYILFNLNKVYYFVNTVVIIIMLAFHKTFIQF